MPPTGSPPANTLQAPTVKPLNSPQSTLYNRVISMSRRLYTLLILATLLLTSLAPVLATAKTEVVLRTHSWWQPPPAYKYNPFAPKAIRIDGLVYERLAYWIKVKGVGPDAFAPELAVGWEAKGDSIIVYLRKNVYWHDGEKFTCKDVWTTLMIYKAFNRPVWKYVSEVRCLDDYTVEYKIKKWSPLIYYYILFSDGQILASYKYFGKFAEKIAKATTKEELEKIRKEILEYEPPTIIGTGPFKFVRITSSEVILEKFPKYWNADKIKIDKIVMPYITSNEVGWQYYLTGRLDYDCFMMPPQVLKKVQEKPFAKVVKIYDLSGFALVFNFKNKWLRKLEVRRAIAYAINREKVAYAAGAGLFEPAKYPTGLLKVMEDKWIGDLIKAGALETYDYNPAKAEELLKKAGFTKKNGKWYTPDGEPFKLTLIAPGGWTDWVAAAEEIKRELTAFGIEVELKTPEAPSYWSTQWYFGGNYDLAIDFYGVWMTYPWRAFKRIWIEVDNYPKTQVQGKEFGELYKVYLPYFKKTVNIPDLVDQLAGSLEFEKQKEAAELLAYAVNYYLPQYPIAEKKLLLYYNVGNFYWPDPQYNFALWQNAAGGHLEALAFMIKLGAVVPKPEKWGVSVSPPPKVIPIPKPMIPAKTATPTATPAKTPAATATVTKTVEKTVTTTVEKTKTVTTTVTAGAGMGLAIGLLVLGLVIGIAIGYFIRARKS